MGKCCMACVAVHFIFRHLLGLFPASPRVYRNTLARLQAKLNEELNAFTNFLNVVEMRAKRGVNVVKTRSKRVKFFWNGENAHSKCICVIPCIWAVL